MNPEYYAICHQRIQALATPAQEAAGKNLMDELLQMNGPAPF
jgi:hypothetical protein